MTLFQALVYGIVQGLAEFLPVSSSGHLALVPRVFGWPDQGQAFDVALHIGTLLPLFFFFRHDLWRLFRAFLASVRERSLEGDPDRRMAWCVLIGSLPGGAIGYLLEKQSEGAFRDLRIIAAALAAMGVVLWASDRFSPSRLSLTDIGFGRALLIGLAQALAIIPGVSRSGATISAGRLCQLDRGAAARFSFLLAAPITTGAVLKKVPHLLHEPGDKLPLVVGIVAAALSGYLAIGWLLKLVRTRSYLPFAIWRVAVGGSLLAAVYLFGWTPPGGF